MCRPDTMSGRLIRYLAEFPLYTLTLFNIRSVNEDQKGGTQRKGQAQGLQDRSPESHKGIGY